MAIRKAAIWGARGVFALVPGLLYWYGSAHCDELACIGPVVNGLIEAVVCIPLFALWGFRRRPRYPMMLAFAEAAMTFATLRRDFDFSPQFLLPAVLAALVVGWVAGQLLEWVLAGRRV